MTLRGKRFVAATLFVLGSLALASSLPVGYAGFAAFERRVDANPVLVTGTIWDNPEGNVVTAGAALFGSGVLALIGAGSWRRRAVVPRRFIPDTLRGSHAHR